MSEFAPTTSTLQALEATANHFDFGLFIFSADDDLTSRGSQEKSTRDNVVLEFGLFLGALGHERTFGVVESGQGVRIPTDLAGISLERFTNNSKSDLTASVTAASIKLSSSIEDVGRRHRKYRLIGKWTVDQDSGQFQTWISATKLQRHSQKVRNHSLVLVAMEKNDLKNFEDDTKIAKSNVRKLSKFGTTDIPLHAKSKPYFSNCSGGKTLEAHLLLVSNGFQTRTFRTIGDMIDAGAELLDTVEYGIADEN